MRGKKSTIVNIALCLCSFVLALLAAECALRIAGFQGLLGYKIWMGKVNSRNFLSLEPEVVIDGHKYKLTDGNCYSSDPAGLLPLKLKNDYDGKFLHCVIYEAGQRRQGYNPGRERQIALVGDSFTFGEGVKETDTLGYILNNQYPNINFQNWGERGADIANVAKVCKTIMESGAAVDEIIYFYNLNDVLMSKVIATHQMRISDYINHDVYHYYHPANAFEKIKSGSTLLTMGDKIWIQKRGSYLTIKNYKDMYFSEANRKQFLLTMDEIQSIKSALAGRGISFRVVIYPVIYKNIFGNYPFEDIHAAVVRACQERQMECLDGYEPFKQYYSLKRFAANPLDNHPNGLSNRLLVDYIYKKDFVKDRPQ